jgi:hypothetical protein
MAKAGNGMTLVAPAARALQRAHHFTATGEPAEPVAPTIGIGL